MSYVYRWNEKSDIYLHAKLWISTPILRGGIDKSFLFYLQNYLCHKDQGVLCPFQPMRAADEPKIDHVTYTLKFFTVYLRILK